MATDDASLSDQRIFAGRAQEIILPSLGDELTQGRAGPETDVSFDDAMKLVDLSARYTIEGPLGQPPAPSTATS